MGFQVLTVSRQLGSRGSHIAARVANELGWRYVDREVIQRAMALAEIPPEATPPSGWGSGGDALRATVERVMQALDDLPQVPAIASATVRESFHSDDAVASLMRDEQLSQIEAAERVSATQSLQDEPVPSRALMERLAVGLARQGSVVLTGRGTQVILQTEPQACHVRVHAPTAERAGRLANRIGLDLQQAHRQVRDSDRSRASFVLELYGRAWDDVDLYHLVINTGRVRVDTAAALIIALIEEPGPLFAQ